VGDAEGYALQQLEKVRDQLVLLDQETADPLRLERLPQAGREALIGRVRAARGCGPFAELQHLPSVRCWLHHQYETVQLVASPEPPSRVQTRQGAMPCGGQVLRGGAW
jgi:hypothetical protein